MFENIRKCLDEYEKTIDKIYVISDATTEDFETIEYFDMDFAKAIMKDMNNGKFKDDEKIAKIILASKGLSNEIKVKVE